MGPSSWWYLCLNGRGLEQHPGGKPGDNQYSRLLEWGAGARVPGVFREMGGGLEEKEAQTNQNNNRAGSRAKRDPALGSSPPHPKAGQGYCRPHWSRNPALALPRTCVILSHVQTWPAGLRA